MPHPVDEDSVESEIQLLRERLAACPSTSPQRGNAFHDLAASLYRNWKLTFNTALLDEAIKLHREALALRPDGHSDHAALCNHLANALRSRYQMTGGSDLLDQVITLYREALALRPAGHPGRAMSGSNLANALRDRYLVMGGLDLLDQVIKLYREALALRPAGHPDRSMSCNNLAIALHNRYWVSGSYNLLDEVVELHREALTLRPGGHPQHSESCNNLASALHDRYHVTGSYDLLDEIIALYREALALRPDEHPYRAISCNNLAIALHDRYRVLGSYDLLDEIVKLHREALALRSAEHPDHCQSCNNLANALHDCYRVTGSSDLLDEIIKLHQEALALRPHGHPDRAMSCNNLAIALRDRYLVTGGSDLLDKIVRLHREALALRPEGNPDHWESCNNLANALRDRYRVTGSSNLLDEIIALYREALALQPGGHPDRAMSCNNLTNALHERYRVTGGSSLLDEIIALYREALTLQPGGHPDRAMSCNNLANALHDRYRVTGSYDLLDEIVKLHREALALRPEGNPDHSQSCNNLASALQDRYRVMGSSDLLGEIVALNREALDLRPDRHPYRAISCIPLAEVLWQHFIIAKDVTVVDEVLALAREAAASASPSDVWRALLILFLVHMEQGSPHFSISTATEYLLQASASIPLTITDFMNAMQSHLDGIWPMHGIWTPDTALRLLDVYSNIIDSLSRMTGFAFDTISQLTALRAARSFGSDACVAALLSSRPRQAIELIDHAHGVIWAQALHQRDPQLQDIPRSLASELEALFRAVSMPVATPQIAAADPATRYLSPEDIRHQQNSRIQTILKEVRAMPGLERFMLGRTYAQLRETARKHPVVVLVSARVHVYALVIRDAAQEAPDELHLEITSDRLSALGDAAARVGLRQGGVAQDLEMDPERSMYISRRKKATALDTLANLWQGVVRPVVDHLQLQPARGRAKPRLHWCPTGDFAFLPIHAAGVYDGPVSDRVCCSDYMVSSYTPTLSALLNAQNKAPQTAPSRLDILTVGEDARALPTMPRLWFVERELTTVEDTAKASKHECSVDTIANHATVERVTDQVQNAHFVHLACHGTQDQTNALESGFHLSDGKLTVSKLMKLNLDKAWFAYLSACETAKSDAKQPDQVVHIASAMLHAGFKSVVATMWSMGDVDGPDLAKWFYEDLLSNEVIDADAVAYSLDAAVEKLRAKIPSAAIWWAPYIHMGA